MESAYEKSKERLAEEARERERRKTDLFTEPNTKYRNYQLSFQHPILGAFYDDFFKHYGIPRIVGMGDKTRPKYEGLLWKHLHKAYRRFNPGLGKVLPKYEEEKHLAERLFGYQEQAFNDFLLRVIDLPKELTEFYKTYHKELAKLAEDLKPPFNG